MDKIELPLRSPRADIEKFCGVIRREIVPATPPLVELIIDDKIIRELSEKYLGAEWVEPVDSGTEEKYLDNIVNFWHRFGYDYIRVSGGLDFPGRKRVSESGRSWTEEGKGIITNREEFDSYPWPRLEDARTRHYEYVSERLPEGMGLFVCPTSGFLETPLSALMGYEALSHAVYDSPGLVKDVVDRVGALIYGFYEKLLGLDNLYGFFQGDDMGFKTGTLVAPDFLREYIFPWHKKLARLAHDNGLLYLLHSCGNLEAVMDDLIDDVGIDAKHSFEDSIMPAADFKRKYGDRVAVLGGVDVNILASGTEDEVRAYTRDILQKCMPGGGYALGSGNSIADYIPAENYRAMLEEGLNQGG